MLNVENIEVKDASRIYGDLAEKKAFNMDWQTSPLVGTIIGAAVGARIQQNKQQKLKEEQLNKMKSKNLIENDHYGQINQILKDMKVVFTPINVIFSVNGQVFEIIGVNEMDDNMRSAFINRDGNYYRQLLINKMGMEMQLAQQAFAQRLLMHQMNAQNVPFVAKQAFLLEANEEDMDSMIKIATIISDLPTIQIPITFDNLRPFGQSSDFTDLNVMSKIASPFDWFKKEKNKKEEIDELGTKPYISVQDLAKNIEVGFLPDRVLFLYNGQLYEQLSLMSMNEDGYAAFLNKDKEFFKKWFLNAVDSITNNMSVSQLSKTSSSLEEVAENVIEGIDAPEVEVAFEKVFEKRDVHPLLYQKILSEKYGVDWYDLELEALCKQIEVDYYIAETIDDLALNKIAAMHALMSDQTSMFTSSFTFEKFVRAMNNKEIDLVRFEGNLSLSEIIFALEIAKVMRGDNVFYLFDDVIPQYVAQELFDDNLRYISDQMYAEFNESEREFFQQTNHFLMRKFKEKDSLGAIEEQSIALYEQTAEMIVLLSEQILDLYANEIDMEDPYKTTDDVIDKYHLLDFVPPRFKDGVRNAIRENVLAQYDAALFLEYKRNEMRRMLKRMNTGGEIIE